MKKKILIIDDDSGMLGAIKRLLIFEGKYDIAEAQDGVVAEQKIKVFSPDLIILDIKMPNRDGYEVCLNLRKDPQMNHVKIIAMTGHSGAIGQAIMEALGADYFFEKPFDNEKLKKKIGELLAEGSPA